MALDIFHSDQIDAFWQSSYKLEVTARINISIATQKPTSPAPPPHSMQWTLVIQLLYIIIVD